MLKVARGTIAASSGGSESKIGVCTKASMVAHAGRPGASGGASVAGVDLVGIRGTLRLPTGAFFLLVLPFEALYAAHDPTKGA